jgi:hypothetical protein
MGGEDAGRLERAKQKIHGILLTYHPRCARFQQLGLAADAAEEDDVGVLGVFDYGLQKKRKTRKRAI